MRATVITKYAELLLDYCMELKAGERLLVNTTTLAEPLVTELYQQCMVRGVVMDVIFDFEGKVEHFNKMGHAAQAGYLSPTYELAMREFEGYLVIRAPFEATEARLATPEIASIASDRRAESNNIYFKRTATRELKRNLCQYPTEQGAKSAGMSLKEHSDFIVNACYLDEEVPADYWRKLGKSQQHIVDRLNSHENFSYVGNGFNISFNTKGRTWINSDGKTNMPSGEVYTSPVENSVQGNIRFSFPSLFQGYALNNVELQVKDGYITDWSCDNDWEVLNEAMNIPGARRFGEAAIGTNYRIGKLTRNILFDEKIGGSVHMAVGQSYLQAGGKNESTLHWDMITDMTQGGKILADGVVIYENGKFLF